MELRCPVCRSSVTWSTRRRDAHTVPCGRGHTFHADEGVLALVTPERAATLAAFDADVARHRAAQGLARPQWDLATLPESAAADPEWRRRSDDLRWIQRLLQRSPQLRTAVDVGAFNGWLSQHLQAAGLETVAVDLFRDSDFGLGARARYPEPWPAVQADVWDAALFAGTFDLVVLNHGVHFLPEPCRVIARWQRRVSPGGALVVLGLAVWADPRARRRRLAELAAQGDAAGATLFPLGGPGLLDLADAAALRRQGLQLLPELRAWRGHLRARLQRTRPRHYRGLYRAPGVG